MANKKEEAVIEPKDVIVGDPKALVTIMIFIDYESEKSAQAHEIGRRYDDEQPDDDGGDADEQRIGQRLLEFRLQEDVGIGVERQPVAPDGE